MIWPWLLVLCVFVGLFINFKLACIYALHILSMQLIKYFDLSNQQVLFFACFAVWSGVCINFDQKIAGVILAVISLMYLAHVLGGIEQGLKAKIADYAFILGLILGGIHGSGSGILVGSTSIHNSGSDNVTVRRAGTVETSERNHRVDS